MTVDIRRAAHDDARTLARLNDFVHQMHVKAQPERYKPLDPNSPALIAHFDRLLADETAHIYIAQVGDEAVGHLVGGIRQQPENPFVYSLRDFHIDAIVVEPRYQGQGIGHLLLEHALTTAQDLHAEIISLGVAAFNQHAITFYERHGFTTRMLQLWQQI